MAEDNSLKRKKRMPSIDGLVCFVLLLLMIALGLLLAVGRDSYYEHRYSEQEGGGWL